MSGNIESLEAQYETLLKQKVEMLQKEVKEAEERKQAELKKVEEEKLRAQIKAELVKEIGEKSVVQPTTERITMQADVSEMQQFAANFAKKHNLTGKPYEQYIKEKFGGGY